MMKSRVLLIALVLGLAAVVASGCGGGGAKVQASTTTTTMGQELSDLKKAYDEGIITEKQYEESKKKVLKRYEK